MEKKVSRPLAIDAAVVAVAKFAASEDDMRPLLATVCLRDNQAIAADGFMLARVPLPKLPDNVESLDQFEGDVLIDAKAMIARINKGREKGVRVLVKHGDELLARSTIGEPTTDLPTPAMSKFPDDAYPDPAKIWPDVEPSAHCRVDAVKLRDLCDAIIVAQRALGLHKNYIVPLDIFLRPHHGSSDWTIAPRAMELDSPLPDGRMLEVLLMPVVYSNRTVGEHQPSHYVQDSPKTFLTYHNRSTVPLADDLPVDDPAFAHESEK